MKVRVTHCKFEPNTVYIGRPSIFGNPFSKQRYPHLPVEALVQLYREWVVRQPHVLAALAKLKRLYQDRDELVLGCWCKTPSNPNAPCHGDVLKEILESEEFGRVE